jgi:uracil-DNA glycosylase family 4
MMPMPANLDALNAQVIACCKCPRLVAWREQVAREKRRAYRDWDYWGRPVPGFGDPAGRLWVVGLAPGAHGSNRTGRHFTGDASGDFLFPALYRSGFASQPYALSREDGLHLTDLYISAACRCAPPDNKPLGEELTNCFPYLEQEYRLLSNLRGVIALGRVAFESMQRLFSGAASSNLGLEFGHNRFYQLEDGLPWLMASYHPSRQNTQTGLLSVEMFDAVWQQARRLLDGLGQPPQADCSVG